MNFVRLLNFSTSSAHAGKLKVVLGSPDAVPGCFKLRCEQMVEVGLVKSAIARRVTYFQGFPFSLDLIESRIHREDVNVIMRVGNPIDRPGHRREQTSNRPCLG